MILKKITGRIFLIFLGVVLAAFSAELYFRIFHPQSTFANLVLPYDFHCFVKGTFYRLALRPNANCKLHANEGQFEDIYIKTNSLGLRNPEIKVPKPPGTTRILFIGDSYTMGWGVNEQEAYPRRVEALLSAKFPGKNIEVINAGVATTGPNYYYLYLKNEGLKLDPDIVVVGFWMVNDIPDNVYFTDWVKTDNEGLPTEVASRTDMTDPSGNNVPLDLPLKFKVPYLRYSHLFAYIADRLFPIDTQYNPSDPLSPRACLYKRFCHDLDGAKQRTKKLFWGMKRLVEKDNKKFLVAFIPAEFQIDRKARLKYGITVPLLPADKEYPYEEFGGFFAENNIDYLDMRPEFLKNRNGQYYFKADNHWNSAGHKLAAEILGAKLGEILND